MSWDGANRNFICQSYIKRSAVWSAIYVVDTSTVAWTKKQYPDVLEATANKTMKTAKIKLQETQRFNVENPSNAKGKNHGRQPAITLLYRVFVYNA